MCVLWVKDCGGSNLSVKGCFLIYMPFCDQSCVALFLASLVFQEYIIFPCYNVKVLLKGYSSYSFCSNCFQFSRSLYVFSCLILLIKFICQQVLPHCEYNCFRICSISSIWSCLYSNQEEPYDTSSISLLFWLLHGSG